MKRLMLGLLLPLALFAEEWSKEKKEHLVACAEKVYPAEVSAYPSFHYPFSAVKRMRLKEHKQETLPLFSYGSLVNLQSACRTLSEEALATREPAIAFAVKRVFNYDPLTTSLGPPKDPEYRAMLNLEKTNDPKNIVNGVVLEVPRESLVELCEREVGYDLIPVLYTLWDEALEVEGEACPSFSVAYTFLAPDEKRADRVSVNRDIQPRPEYYKLVRAGAADYGPQFLQLFIETTYTGSGKPIADQELLKRAP